jgi:hypothetical protein
MERDYVVIKIGVERRWAFKERGGASRALKTAAMTLAIDWIPQTSLCS